MRGSLRDRREPRLLGGGGGAGEGACLVCESGSEKNKNTPQEMVFRSLLTTDKLLETTCWGCWSMFVRGAALCLFGVLLYVCLGFAGWTGVAVGFSYVVGCEWSSVELPLERFSQH